MLKPGLQSTELWLTVATNIGALFASLAGALPPKWAAIATAVATSSYALARGLAKTGSSAPPVAVVPAAPPQVG